MTCKSRKASECKSANGMTHTAQVHPKTNMCIYCLCSYVWAYIYIYIPIYIYYMTCKSRTASKSKLADELTHTARDNPNINICSYSYVVMCAYIYTFMFTYICIYTI